MKLKLLIVALAALVSNAEAAPGNTNAVFSQLTVSNMFYTNRIALQVATSNVNYLTTNNFTVLSNLTWQLNFNQTNGVISSNVAVIIPGTLTNRFDFTNGTLRRVSQLP